MATKLKNLHLTSVDLVRAGANQEADICLYKSAAPVKAPYTASEKKKNIIEQFLDWLREDPVDDEKEPQSEPQIEKEEIIEEPQKETPKEDDESQSFKEITDEASANEILDLYLDAIEDSIESIQLDDTLDEKEKENVMYDSLTEFINAVAKIVPDLCATKPEEEECEKATQSNDMLEVTDNLDEVQKYNHNHGSDGRFASNGGGGGGAAAASKVKTTTDASKFKGYDKALAAAHMSNWGKIFLDSYGSPMEVEDVINDGLAKSWTKKSADYDTIQEVQKYNQNHDSSGRFASSGGGAVSGKFDTKQAESTLNEAGKSRLNGGPASRWHDKVYSVLENAPVGTVITTTENRGAHSQYTKDEKGWAPSWDEPRRLTDKQLTTSLIGTAYYPASMIDAKITTKDTAPTKQQIKQSQQAALSGKLDQALRGAEAQKLGKY